MSGSNSGNQMDMSTIKMVSWNVRGLGHAVKRGKVFAHLKSLKADIMFLQETHIIATEQRRLRASWISQVYQSPFTSKARGVAILFRKNVQFQLASATTDPNGRYIMINGCINSFPVTFLNIYGPNTDDPNYFRKVFDLIPDLGTTNLIMGGDFNCYLDPYLDRLSSRSPATITSVQTLNNLIKSSNMVDIWRLQHPTDKDYSYYSHVHKSYTRIDYFLVDANLISSIEQTKYHNIIISDHSPVSLNLTLALPKQTYCWRFNPLLLSDNVFMDYMATRLEEFLETNDTGEVSDSTLWETVKVVMRGHIISFEASKKKEQRRRLSEIENALPILEQSYRGSLSQEDYNKILNLKYEYNRILSGTVGKLLLKVKQKHFELGDKPERLLARQLKGARANRAIYKIKSKTGGLLVNPREINDRFKDFYSELYTAKSSATGADLASFFDSLDLPALDESSRLELDSDFTECELVEAIKSFPSGRASGPDGFGCEFYKAFHKRLAPLLLRMIKDSTENKKFPGSLYEANICLLLKKGKEDTEPGSYRPIALLNFDQKSVTKVLANRLGRHISSIIHPDQTGFIPGRFSFCNVRRLLNNIYANRAGDSRAAVLALDAAKAFDQIEWPFMFESLRRFGFGDSFIGWVKMLYLCPKSYILTNSDRSGPLGLHRGVRQGDPLSPLLFDVALEPMAIGIRSHPGIRGIGVGGVESRLGLYADDSLVYLSDPETSVPPLLDFIESFGRLSGYTINWGKSEFMPLSDSLDPRFLDTLPFTLVKDHFTYLGLKVSRNPKHLFKLNFADMIQKLKLNIEKWRTLPLSMVGRINAIKMVALPRFLYLFQNLPIFLTSAFFKQLDAIVLPFVWGYKAHRISKVHLQKSTEEGGFGLPVFRNYYWAANARALMYWRQGQSNGAPTDSPLWPSIEATAVQNSSLCTLLFSKTESPCKLVGNHFILKNSIRILNQIRSLFKLPNTSIHTPICYNHSFPPGQMDGVFAGWRGNGLVTLKNLYIDKHFASFGQLKTKFNVQNSHHFRYFQIRHYVQGIFSNFETMPTGCPFYDLMLLPPDSKHLISRFVSLFSASVSTHHLQQAWSEELELEVSDDVWNEALTRIHTCSINVRYKLIQFKVVHRLHYSKLKLHRIYPSVSPLCDRCRGAEGSLSHLFWSCPQLYTFWCEIFKWFSKVYGLDIAPDPELALLGCSETALRYSSEIQQTLLLGMVAAKKMILLDWKSPTAPCFRKWLSEMIGIIQMERIRFHKSKAHDRFLDIWGPFIDYLKDN